MSNPTSNYGWQMPTATDLVTDLPADFEVFGQAVDTSLVDLLGGTTGQVLAKASNANMDFAWIANDTGDITGVTAGTGISGGGTSGTVTITNDMATTITAAGDLVVGTGSGTYDNLPIGTTAQVLTADTTVSPYKVKWATAGATATNFELINAGGTTMSGATTITISGISGKNKLFIFMDNAISGNSATLTLRLNTDTGTNYRYVGNTFEYNGGTASYYSFESRAVSATSFSLTNGASASPRSYAMVTVDGANSAGIKPVGINTSAGTSGTNARYVAQQGFYVGTSTISSISIISDVGNFTSGTLYVYGA